MENLIKDPLIVMSFPILETEKFDRDATVKALLDRRKEIEDTFKNNEYLKLDFTRQEIVGLKSTNPKFSDYIAINLVLRFDEKYKNNNIVSLHNVDTLFDHYCD